MFVVHFGAAKGCLTLVGPAFVADLYGAAALRQHRGRPRLQRDHCPGRRADANRDRCFARYLAGLQSNVEIGDDG